MSNSRHLDHLISKTFRSKWWGKYFMNMRGIKCAYGCVIVDTVLIGQLTCTLVLILSSCDSNIVESATRHLPSLFPSELECCGGNSEL